MGKGQGYYSKEHAKVEVKKQDFLKKYGSSTQMRLKKYICGEEEYAKYHQKFREEYKEGVIKDYNSSKNLPCYQKKILDHVLNF